MLELPVSKTLDTVQVIWPGTAMLILGTPTAAVTVTLAVLVQPLMGFVAVTVYVPADPTEAGSGEFAGRDPPFQTSMFPALVPLSVTEETMQVNGPLAAPVTVGGVVLDVTVTTAVLVQPFVTLVAVTV